MKLEVNSPLRIDLTGGATDLFPFREKEVGRIINFAINLDDLPSVTVICETNARESITLQSDEAIDEISSWKQLEDLSSNRLSKAVFLSKMKRVRSLEFGKALQSTFNSGVACTIHSRAPIGSGLGSSGSIGVSLLLALNSLLSNSESCLEDTIKYRIASEENSIEQDRLHINGGGQDQIAALFGGFNDIKFADHIEVSKIFPPLQLQQELVSRSIVIYTGQSRISGSIITGIIDNYVAGVEKTVKALRGIKGLGTEMRALLEYGSASEIGNLLRKNWNLRLDLQDKISTPQIEQLMLALKDLVDGGYVCGAGGGGCCYFIAREGLAEELKQMVAGMGFPSYSLSMNEAGTNVLIDVDELGFLKPNDLHCIQTGKYNGQAAMAMLINGQGELLLILRDNKPDIPHPNYWDLIGGVVEKGETREEVMQREITGKTGCLVRTLRPYAKIIDHKGTRRLVSIYVAQLGSRLDELRVNDGAVLQYFHPRELPSLRITPFLKEVILDYFFGHS